MAIRFQYNKTSLQDLNKQLKIRRNALPTLQNKEAALRAEVKRSKDEVLALEARLQSKIADYEAFVELWAEFKPDLLRVEDVVLTFKKVAGVKTPLLEDVVYSQAEFSVFNNAFWYLDGIAILKELARMGLEREVAVHRTELLEFARKKTTQKVNLYEKVQIPGYEDAIRKIKRFMEDEENLSKSAQKIVKKRQESEG